jgi:hypothetical protein
MRLRGGRVRSIFACNVTRARVFAVKSLCSEESSFFSRNFCKFSFLTKTQTQRLHTNMPGGSGSIGGCCDCITGTLSCVGECAKCLSGTGDPKCNCSKGDCSTWLILAYFIVGIMLASEILSVSEQYLYIDRGSGEFVSSLDYAKLSVVEPQNYAKWDAVRHCNSAVFACGAPFAEQRQLTFMREVILPVGSHLGWSTTAYNSSTMISAALEVYSNERLDVSTCAGPQCAKDLEAALKAGLKGIKLFSNQTKASQINLSLIGSGSAAYFIANNAGKPAKLNLRWTVDSSFVSVLPSSETFEISNKSNRVYCSSITVAVLARSDCDTVSVLLKQSKETSIQFITFVALYFLLIPIFFICSKK